MAEFQKTEREIEERLEEAEKLKMGSASRSSSPESMDNDSQVDARAQGQYLRVAQISDVQFILALLLKTNLFYM